MPIVLDPDPASTYGAGKEYRDAWFAEYGHVVPGPPTPPVDPPPPPVFSYVISDSELDVLEHGQKLEDRYAAIDSLGRVLQNGAILTDLGGGAPVIYIHEQTTPAATWTIEHGLGSRPDLLLFLDSFPDEPVFTDVTYPDENTAVVEWPSEETGKVYI